MSIMTEKQARDQVETFVRNQETIEQLKKETAQLWDRVEEVFYSVEISHGYRGLCFNGFEVTGDNLKLWYRDRDSDGLLDSMTVPVRYLWSSHAEISTDVHRVAVAEKQKQDREAALAKEAAELAEYKRLKAKYEDGRTGAR
jgi:hypothetical protein